MIKETLQHATHYLAGMLLLSLVILCTGCATKAKTVDTVPVAFVDTMTIPLDYEQAWKLTRDVLLEQEGIEIYTRDKRGLFIVYTDMHREKILYPKRSMLTITLVPDTNTTTKIEVETVAQHYRVSPLTYPGWRDTEEVSEEEVGQEILESIRSTIASN